MILVCAFYCFQLPACSYDTSVPAYLTKFFAFVTYFKSTYFLCPVFDSTYLGSTYFLCPMFLHVLWDFPINGLFGVFAPQKIVVTWSGREPYWFQSSWKLDFKLFLDFPSLILYKLWNTLAYVACKSATLY